MLLGEGARRREGVSDFRFIQNKALFPHTTQEGLDLHTHSKCEEISNNQSAKDICARTRVLEESCLPTKLLGTFNLLIMPCVHILYYAAKHAGQMTKWKPLFESVYTKLTLLWFRSGLCSHMILFNPISLHLKATTLPTL